MIKIGVCDWVLPDHGTGAAEIAAKLGIEAISTDLGSWKDNYPLADPDVQKLYLNEREKYGIEYSVLALNDFNSVCLFAPKGTPDYDITRTIIKKSVHVASILGASAIQVPHFGVSEIKNEQAFKESADVLQMFCDYAGEKGIAVASENLMSPEEFAALYDAVDRNNYYVLYDSQNYDWFCNCNQVEYLNGLYRYISPQVHVKDGTVGLGDAPLGQGHSDFAGTMDTLRSKNFSGTLILENSYHLLPLSENDPYYVVKEDIAVLRDMISAW